MMSQALVNVRENPNIRHTFHYIDNICSKKYTDLEYKKMGFYFYIWFRKQESVLLPFSNEEKTTEKTKKS